MSSADKKLLRKKEKDMQKEAAKKVGLFNMIPEECNVCKTPLDRKSKEMAQTWFVSVYEEDNVLDLFCPDCWSKINEDQSKTTNIPKLS